MTEDLQPRVIAGPPRYTSRTDKPVEYIAIADQDGVVLGYFYANDEDDRRYVVAGQRQVAASLAALAEPAVQAPEI